MIGQGDRHTRALLPLFLVIFACALLAYLAALPLGFDRVGAARMAAQGVGLGAWVAQEALPPLALLLMRLAAYLPLGDIAVRANLASAIMGALAVAFVAQLACEMMGDLRPPLTARSSARDVVHEPVCAAAGAAIFGSSLAMFLTATSAGPAAVALAVVALGWILVMRVARAPGDAFAGGCLALLVGVAAGAGGAAQLLLWPPFVFLALWALRRGERWPLVAPLLFTVGAGVVLLFAARGPHAVAPLHDFHTATRGLSASSIAAAASEAGEQMGVVGLLTGAVGLLVLVVRSAATFFLSAAALILACVASAAQLGFADGPIDDAGWGLPFIIAAAAAPIAAGTSYLASRLGPGRLAGALVLALTATVSPLLDGGASRWTRDVRLAARIIEKALAAVPLRAVVNPGTPHMESVFRYSAGIGLRPDTALTLKP